MLRLLTLLGTRGLAVMLTQGQLKRSLARLAASMAALAAVMLLVLIAFGFAIAALFLWLDQYIASHWAALATSGVILSIAGAVLLLLRGTRRHRRPPQANTDVLGDMTSELGDRVARQPRTALIVAMVTGLGLGLWLR